VSLSNRVSSLVNLVCSTLVNCNRGKISGPLLDRIDIQIEVPALPENELMAKSSAESSVAVRERVTRARARQSERQGKPNAALTPKEIELHCHLDSAGETLVRQAITRLNLSARAYHRILKLALTLADLAGAGRIETSHLAEAIQYRRAFN
jgi:magnesium chelatase family protein